MAIPFAYQAGYEKARRLNPDLAAKYIEQTTKDDPVADAVIETLVPYGHEQKYELIKAAMEKDEKTLARAPKLLREFFDDIEPTPTWFDSSSVLPGCVGFHRYSDLFIPAFVVATVQNASTLIAKAFCATGRVLSGFGPRGESGRIPDILSKSCFRVPFSVTETGGSCPSVFGCCTRRSEG